jgi:hypothetical protein
VKAIVKVLKWAQTRAAQKATWKAPWMAEQKATRRAIEWATLTDA